MGGPRVATVTSPSGRAMQWVEGMQDKHHPTFSQHQLFLLFPSKAWERAKQEHLHHSRSVSITACRFIPARIQGLQGYLCRTLSERVNEKGRIPSTWKGLRAPLFLALSSLSFSYQASTLVAAELWLLMWVASRRVVYYVLLCSVQESVTLKQRSCDTEQYIFSH